MDNISRRLSSEDTATSMYLSFDAESTMSTACYKTLETSDISALSAIDMNNSVNNTGENHMNSTLEADKNSQLLSPLKTVKKMEMPDVKLNTPLRALPKNILKEYKALCSTPSKEQLLKTVNVTRGSDATRCVDLGLAFLDVDDEKPAYFPPPPAMLSEENKENALPETEEVSTLSTCSSIEITTSVIERKMHSTVDSITEGESVEEVKIVKNFQEEVVVSTDVDKNLVNSSVLEDINAIQIENKTINMQDSIKQINEKTPKAKIENIEYMATITEYVEKPGDKTPVVKELEVAKKSVNKKSSSKPKIAVLTRNTRRSTCEPNLQTNKPSRIFNTGNKRQSLLPTSRKYSMPIDTETEIPLLMNKILKITNDTTEESEVEVKQQQEIKDQKPNSAGKRRSVMTSMKARTSLIPSVAGDKRPFSFTQRMSVVVKTTLNSPARKTARKSCMGGVMPSLQRRSVISQKSTTTDSSKIKKPELVIRKSMLPRTSAISTTTISYTKSLTPLHETTATAIQRKSLYPLTKDSEKSKTNSVGTLSHNKPDIFYTCNVCKEKFRIKSLVDAHKRSHESDNVTPAFIKKTMTVPLPTSGSVLLNINQCKYCDKKFALTRALHIHLLQNCSKIPPAEKKKLQYTDLNHVEKAQLPNVFTHHNNLQSNTSSALSSKNATPRHALKQNTNTTFPKSSTESINENKDIQKITSNLVTSVDGTNMTVSQGSVQKIKKKTAHAGVYRTPSKSVPCHLCKLTFKSILDYTNHNLTIHGSNKHIRDANNDFDVEDIFTTTNG